jgi:hypothetical protein
MTKANAKIVQEIKERIEWLEYYKFKANPVPYRPRQRGSQVTEIFGPVPSHTDFLTAGEIAGLQFALRLLEK